MFADLVAGLVVFLVALPLCLGIAVASGAPPISGIIAGLVGGIVVGALSGSHTSVSGPAAGLTAVVLAQLEILGSFEAFLLAVMFAGVLQLGLGLARAGILTTFVPTSVIKGLLAAIGIILIRKQFFLVFGHSANPEQPRFTDYFTPYFLEEVVTVNAGALVIGVISLGVLLLWMFWDRLKDTKMPAPLVVVVLGLALGGLFEVVGGDMYVRTAYLVHIPAAEGWDGFLGLWSTPDWSAWNNKDVYIGAATIAIVASIESLLNLEAVDRLDPQQRSSPPNRELLAQGAGNIVAGLLGGIPVTSVIIRGSVNVHSGGQSKRSAVFHGFLLLGAIVALASLLNRIPLSCLAAILLVTGFRLASPKLIKKMWNDGWDQFVPFAATVVAIVGIDLLKGFGIGMLVALGFIMARQSRRPVRRIVEKHLSGEVMHIELPDQVSFLNQMSLEQVFNDIPRGSRVLLDAKHTEYIDPDVLAMIHDYRDVKAPARQIKLTMVGFHERYEEDKGAEVQHVDLSVRELQDLSPTKALEALRAGHERFVAGQRINHDPEAQHSGPVSHRPLATVLSCTDGRVPPEVIFDAGPGDLLGVRVAGAVLGPQVLGSLEYGCIVGGSPLILVLGHTHSKVIDAAFSESSDDENGERGEHLLELLQHVNDHTELDDEQLAGATMVQRISRIDTAAARAVRAVVAEIPAYSSAIRRLVDAGELAIVGVVYDIESGVVEFMDVERPPDEPESDSDAR